MGPALQGIFVGQGPRALPGVRGKTGRRGESTLPYGVRGKECLRYRRADRGVRPYGWVQEVPAWIAGGVEPRPYGVRCKECLRGTRAG